MVNYIKLNEIGSIYSGGTPKTNVAKYWDGDIVWVTPKDLSEVNSVCITDSARKLTKSGLQESSAQLIPAGSVVLSSRAPIGYVAIVDVDFATNQGCKSVKPADSIYNKYVFYYLKSQTKELNKRGSGTTFLELSKTTFSSFEIPICSLPEQKRIVAKIESLFSRLDSAKDSLLRVQQGIKRYRQSVFKSAFEGRFTVNWRASRNVNSGVLNDLISKFHNKKADELRKTQGKSMFTGYKRENLPQEWVLEKLDKLAYKITDGTHKTPTYVNKGVPFISVKDINDMRVSFENCKYITQEEHKILYKRCNPQKGDVLITKSGTIGRLAVVVQDFEFSLFVSVALIKPIHELLDSDYLAYALVDYINKIDVSKTIKGGLVKNFHLEDIKESVLPICSKEEQKEIVYIIESRFERVQVLEDTVEQGLEKIEQLKQSILKKAFEGKLVEPDPNDESIEVLLERINKEKIKLKEESKN